MYLPADFSLNKELLPLFEESLKTTELHYVIFDGNYVSDSKPYKLSSIEARDYVKRLQTLNHVCIGTNRTLPMPWHFGIKEISSDTGILTDFIVSKSDIDTLERDLHFIVELVFLFARNLKVLILPFIAKLDKAQIKLKVKINYEKNETIIYK